MAALLIHAKSGKFIKNSELNRRNKVSVAKQTCDVDDFPTLEVRPTGRRIVDVSLLGKELWCHQCDKALSLKDVVSEKKQDLCSIFDIKCQQCLNVLKVKTSNSQPSKSSGGPSTYDVNYKAAIGMIDAGIGAQQLNSILSSLNIPVLSETLLKRHERKVGPAIEAVAKATCFKMALLEKELSIDYPISEGSTIDDRTILDPLLERDFPSYQAIASKEQADMNCFQPGASSTPIKNTASALTASLHRTGTYLRTEEEDDRQKSNASVVFKRPVPIAATFDAGWQMRGNGKTYNSQSGHGAVMGHHTRKVLDFATRCKICRRCNNNIPQDQHDCRCNFTGSAKAMEPDIAVQLVAHSDILKSADVSVAVLVGDDDSSTMAALRKDSVGCEVRKWSDVTHCKKNVGNALYKLQARHRVLSSKVIKYLQRCFMYAISQNRNKPAKVRNAILNITDHVFGKHANCGDWCKFRLKPYPESRYPSLPHGECLSGIELESAIRNVFVRYSGHSEKLGPCASTQSNEALNSAIAAKNPKSKFYSGSESNDFRVAAAVSQVNVGTQYVISVNEQLGLSPGSNTKMYKQRMDRKRKHTKNRQCSTSTKRRRLFLKNKKTNSAARNENREGLSYQSGMGLVASTSNIPLPNVTTWSSPNQVPIAQYKLAYFDLETTGVSTSSEVVQIAARVDDVEYSRYIQPKYIPQIVTEVTGLKAKNGCLYLNEFKVDTVNRCMAWQGFINFLAKFNVPVTLVGHNITFDMRFTTQELDVLGLKLNFDSVVYGVIDTLKVLKKILPGRVNYKQDDISTSLGASDSTFGAHNALGDVRTLQRIMLKLDVSEEKLKSYYQSFASKIEKKLQAAANKENLETLSPLKDVLSKVMVNKIAAANLKLTDLENVYVQGGEEGLRVLFSENCSGRPRVTKNEKIIQTVITVLNSVAK